MSRKSNKKRATDVEEEEVPLINAADDDDDDAGGMTTEDESINNAEEVGDTTTKQSNNNKSKKKKKKENKNQSQDVIPFMDTFYQLSSEDSPTIRSIAARDLIEHCFPSLMKDGSDDDDVNCKDAAYAITRLMNGLCTGRAASRQGFASCLASFMKVGYPYLNEIMKEDTSTAAIDSSNTNPAVIVREKLLTTTDFLTPPSDDKGSSNKNKKNRFGGGMKGIEARDHAFGRLFGILSIVRSGILSQSDFPSEVSQYIANLLHCCL